MRRRGVPKTGCDKRMRGIAVRQGLTDEWKKRGATSSLEYGILTNEIMQGAFDLKVDAYKQVKGLERENLRDHMTDIELILTMLAEAITAKLHKDHDSKGMIPLISLPTERRGPFPPVRNARAPCEKPKSARC